MIVGMDAYELLLVFRPDYNYSDPKANEEFVKNLINDDNMAVKDVQTLGKKQLAYPIKKHTEGVYITAAIEGNEFSATKLGKKFQVGTDVIRYLVTKKK